MGCSMSRRRKRVNPAVSAIDGPRLRQAEGAETRPPGSERPEDRHESTDTPYISAAIGFLAAFSAKVSRAFMSTSSQTPSRRAA